MGGVLFGFCWVIVYEYNRENCVVSMVWNCLEFVFLVLSLYNIDVVFDMEGVN